MTSKDVILILLGGLVGYAIWNNSKSQPKQTNTILRQEDYAKKRVEYATKIPARVAGRRSPIHASL